MSNIVGDFAARLGLIPDEASWARGDKLLEGIKHGLEALGAYELIHGAKEMVASVTELGSALNDTSQKTGISVEGLQFFGFVAKLNSSNIDELTQSSDKLSKSMADGAKTGTGPAVDGLELLGLSFSKINALSPDERIEVIAAALAKMPDGAKKTAIAMDLFGRSGAQLIPTLNDLGKNGDELRKKFEDLGGAITTDQASALDDFGDNVDMAKYSLTALKNTIVVGMLPALKSLLTSFQEWVAGNKVAIASAARGVVEFAGYIFSAIAEIGRGVANAVAFLQEHTDLFYALLTGLGAAISIFAIKAAISWAIAFFPFFAVVAVITGIAFALKKLFEYITGGERTWSEFGDEIVRQFTQIGDFIVSIPDKIEAAFSAMWSAIKGAAKAAFEWIINLPVIKQLIELYEYFARKATSGEQAAFAKQQENLGILGGTGRGGIWAGVPGLGAPALTAPGASNASAMLNYAPVINVHPAQGQDEAAIGRAVRDEVDRSLKDKMRQASDAIRGGVR